MSHDNYDQLVLTKYNLYNGLFTNLPYEKIENIGMLIPILADLARKGFEKGWRPDEIIQHFFERYTDMEGSDEQISFLFRIIQYVERQVVLFDSVEDAAFSQLNNDNEEHLIDVHRYAKALNKTASFKEKLNSFSTRIVFTAHPTQFYPPSVQQILHDLKATIQQDDLEGINKLLQQLGQTPFMNKTKPSPLDEAKSIIYYLRNVYYKAIGDMLTKIQKDHFDAEEEFTNYDILKLGFWPGGDRDGNPFVTYDITRDVAVELRTTLMKCYYHELKALRRRLSFSKIEPILQGLSDKLYGVMFTGHRSLTYDEILHPLLESRTLLIKHYHSLFLDQLNELITRVKTFKIHFASIDVRQDGPKHHAIMDEIFNHYGLLDAYNTSSDADKIETLINPGIVADPEAFDGLTKDTLLNVAQIKEIQRTNGEDGLHRYIISNSEDIFDVLRVYALFRLCGYAHEDIHIDIVPLFETMKGMKGAEATMKALYTLPAYKAHLNRRNNKQHIMLGFSDGTKDGGYLKANWEIYRTKETLSEVSDDHHIKVVFFDGRGGPPARGGGKAHRFYASQGKNIANHEIQLTIQGQTITSMYGAKEQFEHNCEQLIKAGLTNELFNSKDTILSGTQRALMTELGEAAYEKYTALKAHPQFIPYLEHISTLKYYGQAKIGSRPGKRGNKAQLEFSDLRAISFVGSWSQLKQNVPGYYGIGTALNKLETDGRLQEGIDLFQHSAFFKALMLNSMMSLEKSYFALTQYIKDVPQYKDFWDILHTEYQLSKEMLLKISGYEVLMQEEQQSKASIAIREKIVIPLLTIQQYALQQISKDKDIEGVFAKMVTRSLFGNINASRNSA